MSEPRISVVIPTLGKRPERLVAAFRALAAQDLPAGELEVVVGADPGAAIPPAPDGLALRVVEAERPASAAAKRNLAWRAAAAPLIAFTDDDCRPAPGWATALLGASGPDAFVQGRTEPDPAEEAKLWGFAHSQRIGTESPWHETCNMAYPRELLERLGGFDEGYGLLGGEDTDLGERARQAGTEKRFEPAALVWHAVEGRNFRRALLEATRIRSEPRVIARFPDLRRQLKWGLFHRGEHGYLLLALAGALTRRRSLAAVAAIPYIEVHLRNYRLSPLSVIRAGTHLPIRVLANLIELAVLGWRGIRSGVIAF